MHSEIKISEGIYVTDFRPNASLEGVSEPTQPDLKDLGLLLDKIHNNETKINQLIFSNSAMQEEDNWQ